MKILIIHNRYLLKGGEDTVFEAESDLLKQYGHEVEKLIFDNRNMNTFKEKIVTGLMAIYSISSARVLNQKINEFKPDIIHVHNFFPIASPSIFFTAYQNNIPIVMTLHNYRLLCPNALLYINDSVCELCVNKSFALGGIVNGCYRDSKLQTFLLATMTWYHSLFHTWQNKVTRYIALTHFEKTKFLSSSLGIKNHQISIKPNFSEDYGYSLKKEDFYLYIGRLSPEKGLASLLHTFHNSDQKLYIIGTGPMEEEIRQSAVKYSNIIWLGFQDKSKIIDYLKHAKALIFSSMCYETFGMSVIEAFSTGTPVICTGHGASAELVQDQKTGLHYQAGNSADLKEKIDWLNLHPDQHHQFCVNARYEYETKYTPEKNYEMIMKIYEEAIHAKTKNS